MSDIKYFCIRGFMKSGTNWLGSLIDSHEAISVVGEYHWQKIALPFKEMMKNHSLFQERDCKEFVREEFAEFVKRVLRHNAEPSALLIGDRTPARLEPTIIINAPCISIVRDGRDVLVSRAFHLFNNSKIHRLFERIPAMKIDLERFEADPWIFKKKPELLLRHKRMVIESVRMWREHLEADRASVESNKELSAKFVRYEDLHADTEGVRKSLFEFLGVNPKRAAKLEGVLKPGFKEERPSEFLRKGAVGDWTNYFTDDTKAWFKEEGGEELIRQGYETSLDW